MFDGLFFSANKPKNAQSLGTIEDSVRNTLGYDKNVKHRALMLPFARMPNDDVQFAYPQALIDLMEAAMLPGHAAQGGFYTPQDVTKMALDTGIVGAPVGYATAPKGSIAMGGSKKFKSSGDIIDNSTARFLEKAKEYGIDVTDVDKSKNRLGGRSNYFTISKNKAKSTVRISDHPSNPNFRLDDIYIVATDEKNPADQIDYFVKRFAQYEPDITKKPIENTNKRLLEEQAAKQANKAKHLEELPRAIKNKKKIIQEALDRGYGKTYDEIDKHYQILNDLEKKLKELKE